MLQAPDIFTASHGTPNSYEKNLMPANLVWFSKENCKTAKIAKLLSFDLLYNFPNKITFKQ
jgi:hypothetical protein